MQLLCFSDGEAKKHPAVGSRLRHHKSTGPHDSQHHSLAPTWFTFLLYYQPSKKQLLSCTPWPYSCGVSVQTWLLWLASLRQFQCNGVYVVQLSNMNTVCNMLENNLPRCFPFMPKKLQCEEFSACTFVNAT